MSTPIIPQLGRQPALDGLRGFAVLVVLGHNLGAKWLSGGFFGVDVFFALSGFLITTLLLEEFTATGGISLGRFLARRGRRLYPALLVLVAFSVASAVVLHAPVGVPRVALVAGSVLGYFSNWVLGGSDLLAWTGGMAHTWSLAIEAFFYVFWALVVVAVTRRRGADLRALGGIALMIALGSGLWRAVAWLLGRDPHLLYVATDARLDSVFLGALAAVIRLRHLDGSRPSRLARMKRAWVWGVEALCLGGLAVLIGWIHQDSPAAYLGGFGLAGAATALLILTALLSRHSLVAAVASNRTLGWFGVISYSIYLWHVPVGKFLAVARFAPLGLPLWLVEILRGAIIVTVAMASYYGIERFFLRSRRAKPAELAKSEAVGDAPDGSISVGR